MDHKIRVAVLCGGMSAEHEISLISAVRVLGNLPVENYETALIVMSKEGSFHKIPARQLLAKELDPRKMQDLISSETLPLRGLDAFFTREDKTKLAFDVVFPILHGPLGEDGAIQGLLKVLGLPSVGADVLGSAIGMDKVVSKTILQAHGIETADFMCFSCGEKIDFQQLEAMFGFPMFVKPASLGSSIGIAKAHNQQELAMCIQQAFRFDTKVLVEQEVIGREIECAVLENDSILTSRACEIIPQCEFHSYESKYFAEKAARMDIPAKLDPLQTKQVQELSKKVFKLLSCEGMARIDFFLKSDGTWVVNEINTIPGMTPLSPFPLLWEDMNLPFTEVVRHLIEQALKRDQKRKTLALMPEEVSQCTIL